MNLPKLSAPIIRHGSCINNYNNSQTLPSNDPLGICVDNQGLSIGNGRNFNQTACCALRVARNGGYWINPETGIPVYC